MPLPQTKYALTPLTIPSTNEKRMFRPFLSGEEKILLMALQAQDKAQILTAVSQIVRNCSADGVEPDDITTFDLDYLFLKLRAMSVDNVVKVTYTDPETKEEYPLEVDLDAVEITMPKKTNNKVKFGDITIMLKYPTVGQMRSIQDTVAADLVEGKTPGALADLIIEQCVDRIYDSETDYTGEFTHEEFMDWIDKIPPTAYADINAWVDSIPELSHTIKFKKKDKKSEEVVLRGLEDFFMF